MGVEEQIHADNAVSGHPEDGIQLISEMMRQFGRGASQNQVTFWAIGQLRRLVGASAHCYFWQIVTRAGWSVFIVKEVQI